MGFDGTIGLMLRLMFGLMLGLIPQEEAAGDTCWIEAQGRPLSHRPYNRQHRRLHRGIWGILIGCSCWDYSYRKSKKGSECKLNFEI